MGWGGMGWCGVVWGVGGVRVGQEGGGRVERGKEGGREGERRGGDMLDFLPFFDTFGLISKVSVVFFSFVLKKEKYKIARRKQIKEKEKEKEKEKKKKTTKKKKEKRGLKGAPRRL